MVELNSSLFPYFWDDDHISSNGFQNLTDHVNKSLEMTSTIINLLESRASVEDNYGKIIGKITKNFGKIDPVKTDYAIRILIEILNRESIVRQTLSDEISRECIEPLKDIFKKQFEIIKKEKSDCLISLKNRKNQHEVAIKASKAFTAKVKAHDQLVKRTPGANSDEKLKMKILKNQQSVKLAEKDARVSVEMLNQNLLEYKEAYFNFCAKIESLDQTLIETTQKTLEKLYSTCTNYTVDINTIYSKLINMPLESTAQAYIERFVSEKGVKKVYLGHATLIEEGEGETILHSVHLSPTAEDAPAYRQKTSSVSVATRDSFANEIEVEPIASQINPPNVLSEDHTAKEDYSIVTALYDFEAQNEDELSFSIGTKIEIISKEDDSWYIGKLENGKTGAFPISYASQSQ